MNKITNENIWKLMDIYKFEIDPDYLHDDMLCSICKKLMKDPCLSTCCCQYCFKCISEYIGSEDKFCPGNKEKCKEEYLKIDRDVIRDIKINNKIFKSIVLCPNDWCDSMLELAKMSEHFKVCIDDSMKCPFEIIGCEIRDKSKDSLLSHLQNETLPHTHLLLECINNVRNEVSGIKSSFDEIKVELNSIKEESIIKDEQMVIEKKEMVKQKKEENFEIAKLKMEMIEQKKEMMEQRREWYEEIIKLKMELAANKKETEFVKEELRLKQIQIRKIMEQRSEAVSTKKVMGDEINENVRIRFCNVDSGIRAKYEKMKTKSCPNIDEDFVWMIDEISKKKGKDIFSESFYSNNYKFCLYFRIVDDNIYLRCHIMRGDNDDKVQWPIKRTISISIINQDTMKTYKTNTHNYDTNKCKNAFVRAQNNINNYGIGGYSSSYVLLPFIPYSSIKDNRFIVVNDAIIVSCAIGDK